MTLEMLINPLLMAVCIAVLALGVAFIRSSCKKKTLLGCLRSRFLISHS